MFSRKVFYFGVVVAAALVLVAAGTLAALTLVPASALAGGGPNRSQSIGVVPQATGGTVDRGITVVGVGTAAGTPDVAHVSVGIETSAASVQQAVDDNKGKMSALLGTLKDLGVADKDIQTSNYSVYMQQGPVAPDASAGDSGGLTYRVNNQVEVTVREVSKLGDLLDKAVAAGANNIYGVNFSVDDTRKLEADARAKAIADARSRAASLAELAGVQLGDAVSISEVIGGNGPVYASMAAGLGGGAPIQPGELNVTMSVQVTFAIK